jgi:SAM-dependent methyltransferase
MTLDVFNTLMTSDGERALAAARDLAPTEATFLASFEKLRKHFPADLARAALETVILRSKAAGKFPFADRMFFDREALEQATHFIVAEHRAKRFAKFKTVLDLGCGLGADSIALAQAGCKVIALERDPLRARLAEANFAALGLNVRLLVADALVDKLPMADAIFCDPGRREGGKRHIVSDSYSPSPRDVIERFPDTPLGFKLAPGIPWSDLGRFEGEAECVSLGGELKECRLWLGPLATGVRRATVLPSGITLSGNVVFDRDLREPGKFIFLPDAAVIRAGLEPLLAAELHAGFLDAGQPLLTANRRTNTPLAVAYRFDAVVTGALSRLTATLRERHVGRVTWINIGSPRPVDAVLKSVKLSGPEHRTVMLTRIGGAAAALIVDRVEG